MQSLLLDLFCSDNIWYGKIGVELNNRGTLWNLPTYKKMISSLKSCYVDPEDFKQLEYVLDCSIQFLFSLSSPKVG
jgi:hypothetical protein